MICYTGESGNYMEKRQVQNAESDPQCSCGFPQNVIVVSINVLWQYLDAMLLLYVVKLLNSLGTTLVLHML